MCRREYTDETLSFCLEDGSPLVAAAADSEVTLAYVPKPTERFEPPRNFTAPPSPETFQINSPAAPTSPRRSKIWIIPAVVALLFLIVGGSLAAFLFTKNKTEKSPDTTARTIAANVSDNAGKPAPAPTNGKPPSFKFVGTWETDVNEQGVKTHITYTFNADGTSRAAFKTSRGQTGKDNGTWQFSDDTLFERFSNGASGKGAIRWIDDDTFEITIIDNGTPAYSGLKRIYHRK